MHGRKKEGVAQSNLEEQKKKNEAGTKTIETINLTVKQNYNHENSGNS